MALRDILANFKIKVDGSTELATFDKKISAAKDKLAAFGAIAAALAAGKAMATITGQVVAAGDSIDKQSKSLGIGTKALQQYQFAAGQAAGVTTQELNVALRTSAKSANEAERKSKSFVDAYKEIGVSVTDSAGKLKSTEQIFTETGLALSKVEGSAKKAALAQTLLGRSGAKLLPLFADGEEGLAAFRKEFEALGGGLSEDMVKAAADGQDALGRLDLAFLGLKGRIAIGVLPALTKLGTWVAKAGAKFGKFLEGTNLVNSALGLIGVKGAGGLTKLLKPLLRLLAPLLFIIAKFVIMSLVIDDVVTMFQGGDSVIGRFIDRLFGVGTAAGIAETAASILSDLLAGDFGDAFDTAADAALDAGEAIGGAIWSAIAWVGESLAIIWRAFVDWGNEVWNAITAAGDKWLTGIGDSFNAMIGEALAFADSIVGGIVAGLDKGADKVVKSIVAPFKKGFEAAKKYLLKNSPSRLFSGLSESIPEGAAKGIDKKAWMVDDSVKGMFAGGRDMAVDQINHNNITVNGAGNPRAVANNIGSAIGQRSRQGLNQAYQAMVPSL